MAEQVSRRQFVAGAAAAGVAGLAIGGAGGALIAGGSDDDTREAPDGATTAARSDEPIKIGLPLPLSGPYGADGKQMQNGAELAVKEINESGGVAGRPLELQALDTDIVANDSVTSSFNQLVNAEVDAIVTGYFVAAAGANEIVSAYGAPYLNADTSQLEADTVAEAGDSLNMVFQVVPTEVWYGRGLPGFLTSLAADSEWQPSSNKISIIEVSNNPYSTGISTELQSAAKEEGNWVVDQVVEVILPVTDWGAVLSQLRKAQPGVIVCLHSSPTEAAALAKQFAANPVNALFYHQYAPAVPEFVELAGEGANGVIWSTVAGILPDAFGEQFRQNYRAEFGADPGYSIAAVLYDQIQMLVKAWGRVGDTRDFERVNHELRTMVHRGISGSIWLNSELSGLEGQVTMPYPDFTEDISVATPHLFLQVQGGESKVIGPEPFVNGEFQSAAWMK